MKIKIRYLRLHAIIDFIKFLVLYITKIFDHKINPFKWKITLILENMIFNSGKKIKKLWYKIIYSALSLFFYFF